MKRGISIPTAKKCQIGFDPAADPASVPGSIGNEYKPNPAPRIIIPSSRAHYVGRAISPDTPSNLRKLNNKGGHPDIFNAEALFLLFSHEIKKFPARPLAGKNVPGTAQNGGFPPLHTAGKQGEHPARASVIRRESIVRDPDHDLTFPFPELHADRAFSPYIAHAVRILRIGIFGPVASEE